MSHTEKTLRKASFQLISTHIHFLQNKLCLLDGQLNILKNLINQLCNPFTCLYIKRIVFNLNAQLHNHIQSKKIKKLLNLNKSQCCYTLDSIAEHSSHKDNPFMDTTNRHHSLTTTSDCNLPTIVDSLDHQTTSSDAAVHKISFPKADDGSYE